MSDKNKDKNSAPRGFVLLLVLLLGSVSFLGCSQNSENVSKRVGESNDGEIRVIAVSYPLQYLTERIVGDLIAVECPVPREVSDPSLWKPSREAVLSMQSADWVIANGVGADYAKWLPKVSLPESKLCRTATKGLALADYIAVEDVSIVHSHGPEGEHSHPTMVSRTWLDPAMAKKQAIYIAAQFEKKYPQFAAEFAANLDALTKDLNRLADLLRPVEGEELVPLVTATPLQKFFARAAGVGDLHLTWFSIPEVEQANLELKALLESSDATGGVVLFDRNLPSAEILTLLDDQGFRSLSLDLLDQPPEDGDFLTSLEANILALKKALAR